MARIIGSRSVLAVRDLKSSTQYYIDVIGFQREPIDAQGWSFLVRDNVMLMLGECPDEKPASELANHSWFAYWFIEGIDQFYQEIAARRALISSRPQDKPWGLREFGFSTPDGHRITCGERIQRR
jgi:hypothetical protein